MNSCHHAFFKIAACVSLLCIVNLGQASRSPAIRVLSTYRSGPVLRLTRLDADKKPRNAQRKFGAG
jgi:hypothetical protein